mgnify:CR=1 FL=1
MEDSQIAKLIGTTKPTIQSIRNRTHWNSSNIQPVDPVALGLCTQIALDEAVGQLVDAGVLLPLRGVGTLVASREIARWPTRRVPIG